MDDTPVAGSAPRSTAQCSLPLPRLALIAAVSRNGIIGRDNKMPWHLPGDLRHFRALTVGHSVIMGRKTYESMGRALSRRQNIVISRDATLVLPGCTMAHSLDDALARCTEPEPVFCIGGAEIYRLAIGRVDEIHLTEIDADIAGDALLPAIPRADWREAAREPVTDPASGLRYAFVHLVRIQPRVIPAMPPTMRD
ncbi:MAG: dihydrofolate reductase, partial [Betaproteobacteria bacterium]